MSSDSKAVGQRVHTTFGGDVHPRVCTSVERGAYRRLARASREDAHPWCAALDTRRTRQTSVRKKDVNADAGARADYPY